MSDSRLSVRKYNDLKVKQDFAEKLVSSFQHSSCYNQEVTPLHDNGLPRKPKDKMVRKVPRSAPEFRAVALDLAMQ